MKLKIYKKVSALMLIAVAFAFGTQLKAQSIGQGLYIDTIKWPGTNSITVNIRTTKFSNIVVFNGSVNWDKNSLQFTSVAGNSVLNTANYTFNSTNAVSGGVLSYLYTDPAVPHTVPDGTVALSINFNVINNPAATYNDNIIGFSNSPVALGIDTADATFTDYVSYTFPALQNHESGYVSFARPPYLSYNGTDVTDTVTNRPVGCTYQWFVGGNPISGAVSSSLPNAPTGTITLQVTYPNGTIVTSVNSVLPIKLNSFNGKHIDNTNQLSWSTSSEVNTSNFEIQKSANSKDFVAIGKVNAAGNSNITQQYNFTDANIGNASVVYYRLKMNDNNGAFAYSNIIKVSSVVKGTVSLYPNPSKTSINVTGNQMKQITITNIIGKVVLQQTLNSVNNTVLNVSNLSKGIYNISINSNDGNNNLNFIVD